MKSPLEHLFAVIVHGMSIAPVLQNLANHPEMESIAQREALNLKPSVNLLSPHFGLAEIDQPKKLSITL